MFSLQFWTNLCFLGNSEHGMRIVVVVVLITITFTIIIIEAIISWMSSVCQAVCLEICMYYLSYLPIRKVPRLDPFYILSKQKHREINLPKRGQAKWQDRRFLNSTPPTGTPNVLHLVLWKKSWHQLGDFSIMGKWEIPTSRQVENAETYACHKAHLQHSVIQLKGNSQAPASP